MASIGTLYTTPEQANGKRVSFVAPDTQKTPAI